jgi:maleate isomerase
MGAMRELPTGEWLRHDGFGERGRIGVIVPSNGWTPDHEWPRMLPRGVCHFITRIPLRATTPEELARMGEYAADAAGLLATAKIDVLCYGCTVETMRKGYDYDRAVHKRLSEAAGTPCVTMTGAVIAALASFSAQRIAIVTPYVQELNDLEVKFFQSIGIEVVYMRGMNIAETIAIARIPPQDVVQLGLAALEASADADALLISCGNLRTLEAIPEIERITGKPVVSSNQALIWAALRTLGVTDTQIGVGSLFDNQLGEA